MRMHTTPVLVSEWICTNSGGLDMVSKSQAVINGTTVTLITTVTTVPTVTTVTCVTPLTVVTSL